MECSVIADEYMGLGVGEDALKVMTDLRDACRAVGGSFTLLWHNTQLESIQNKKMYMELLA